MIVGAYLRSVAGAEGHGAVTAADNHLFIEAVLYLSQAGVPWRDLPERFGLWKNVHARFSWWSKPGLCGN
jgi:transposase